MEYHIETTVDASMVAKAHRLYVRRAKRSKRQVLIDVAIRIAGIAILVGFCTLFPEILLPVGVSAACLLGVLAAWLVLQRVLVWTRPTRAIDPINQNCLFRIDGFEVTNQFGHTTYPWSTVREVKYDDELLLLVLQPDGNALPLEMATIPAELFELIERKSVKVTKVRSKPH